MEFTIIFVVAALGALISCVASPKARCILRSKIAVFSLVLIVGLAVLTIFGVFTPFTPDAPQAWHDVYVGMSRSNILQLLGPAQTGYYPEKILETWYRDSAWGMRKLEVLYQRAPDDDRATLAREYIFWKPSRRDIRTRIEP